MTGRMRHKGNRMPSPKYTTKAGLVEIEEKTMRKVSDQEARAKQNEMARATLRKISRRLYGMQDGQLKNFLLACREDIVGRLPT